MDDTRDAARRWQALGPPGPDFFPEFVILLLFAYDPGILAPRLNGRIVERRVRGLCHAATVCWLT
jgi:hypothetical protein